MRKKIAAGIVVLGVLLGVGGYLLLGPTGGVTTRYAAEIERARTGRDRAEQLRLDARMLGNILIEIDRITLSNDFGQTKTFEIRDAQVAGDAAVGGDVHVALGQLRRLRRVTRTT